METGQKAGLSRIPDFFRNAQSSSCLLPLTLVTTKVTYSILESERPERTRLPVDFNKDLREFLRIFCVMPTTKYGHRYYIGIYVATNILNK